MKSDIRMSALSAASGVLLSAAFPNIIFQSVDNPLFFLAWAAYIPLFYVILKEENSRMAGYYSLITHLVFFIISLYWLKNVERMGAFAYVSWFSLAILMSLHAAFAAAAVKFLEKKAGISPVLAVPVMFTLLEFVREHLVFGGFPLLNPAQSQQQFAFVMNILPFAGSYGLMFLIYAVNAYAAYYVVHKKMGWKRADSIISAVLSIMLIVSAVAGFLTYKPPQGKQLDVLILQPDINQDSAWDAKFKETVISNAKALINKASKETGKIYDLIVWPETSFPDILNIRPEQAKQIAAMSGNKSVHIAGADRAEFKGSEPSYFNTAYSVSAGGKILSHYSKHKLVPFGEYIPLQDRVPFIKKVVRRYGYIGFTKGEGLEPLSAGNYKTGAMICYDSLFPEGARAFAKKGASVLAHLSYESWYGVSPASAQVMQNTALRAAENNMWIMRSVESGISAFIDPQGRISASTKLYEKSYLSGSVTLNEGKRTFYTNHGPWFIILLIAALLTGFIAQTVRGYVLPRK